jgi:UDP-glucose 4-epimerase
MTHVENCADLFALAAADPRARGQTFNVVDDEGKRIWSFLGDYLRESGEAGFRIPLSYWVLYGAIRFAYAFIFKRNQKLPHILVPVRFESRLKPLQYTNARARQVLGWSPPLDFGACLQRTFGSPKTYELQARRLETDPGR